MKKRNLDGYYFRVERDGNWDNVCFSDLTHEERSLVLKKFDKLSLTNMCIGLADVIEILGDEFDISCEEIT